MEKVYQGFIQLIHCGEADDVVSLDGAEPLVRQIQEDVYEYGEFLTVSYFISDKEKTIDELDENLIKQISGAAEVDYGDAYSECTGYLWTTEDLEIGGHDLQQELFSSAGKFCHLKIIFNKVAP